MLCAMNKREGDNKNLSQIMIRHKNFQFAIDFFLETLRKKRDWKNLENKVSSYKKSDFANPNVKKLFQWERQAHSVYMKSQDCSLSFIKSIGMSLSDEESDELREWISNHPCSKEAWDKSKITIGDSINIIIARVVHLIYMAWSSRPINIGDLIDSKE